MIYRLIITAIILFAVYYPVTIHAQKSDATISDSASSDTDEKKIQPETEQKSENPSSDTTTEKLQPETEQKSESTVPDNASSDTSGKKPRPKPNQKSSETIQESSSPDTTGEKPRPETVRKPDKTIPDSKSSNTSTDKAQSKKDWSSPFLFYGYSIAYGRTFPSGTFSGSGNSGKQDNGYGTGAFIGYAHNSYLGGMLGLEYLHEKISLNRSFNGKPASYSLKMDFINISLGYRGSWKYLYGDLGFYYGYKIFSWSESTTINGSTTTNSLGGSRSKYCKNPFGIYVGFGGCYEIRQNMFIECGFKGEFALTPAFKSTDTIKPNIIMITVGMSYRTSFNK